MEFIMKKIKKACSYLIDQSPDVKTLRLILNIIIISVMILQITTPVFASSLADGPFTKMEDAIKTMTGSIIHFLIFLGTAGFVVMMVKSGVVAQFAQGAGISHMVSAEIMNIVLGVILFVVMVSIFEVAKWVIDTASAGVDTNYNNFNVPGGG